jgi:hypothetical protein
MGNAADGTAAIMRAGLTGLIGLGGIRSPVIVTDRSCMQRVGGSDAGRPARGDRGEDLHRQGNQDDWKKFP